MSMSLLPVLEGVTVCMLKVVTPSRWVIQFNLNTPQNYQTFVTQVRNEVKDPTKSYYGLPIIKTPDPKKYVYNQLNAAADALLMKPAISVTLQLKTTHLYLVAYLDKDEQGKERAFYFKELVGSVKDVFPDSGNINRELMKCSHDYPSIQGAARKQIKELEFRLQDLEEVMRNAYGKSTKQSVIQKLH